MAETKQKSAPPEAAANEIRKPLEVSDEGAMACYTNFCRVTSAPEEVIIDFGLNATPLGGAPQGLKINQRIVMNYYNAKRLLQALHHTVQRYEATFGTLETDIQKRVTGGKS
jgi:hypothetical protein